MTERNPDRERGEEQPEPRDAEADAEGTGAEGTAAPEDAADAKEEDGPEKDAEPEAPEEPEAGREPRLPEDEEAAWAEIVAGYGEEPDATTLGPEEDGRAGTSSGSTATGTDSPGEADAGTGLRSFTVYAAGTGPRDWQPEDDEDEGHFEPPEPPPLPEADTTTKFAWIAALGGPLLLFACILTQQEMTWWIITLGLGGFLGGFATLVARMRDGRDDDDWDDPGRGAVV